MMVEVTMAQHRLCTLLLLACLVFCLDSCFADVSGQTSVTSAPPAITSPSGKDSSTFTNKAAINNNQTNPKDLQNTTEETLVNNTKGDSTLVTANNSTERVATTQHPEVSTVRNVTEIATYMQNHTDDGTKTDSMKTIHDVSTAVSSSAVMTTLSFKTQWMNMFIHTHHFEGRYMFSDAEYPFDFVVRYVHPLDSRVLVTVLYDADGAVLEFNGTSANNRNIVFKLTKIYQPGVRFPLQQEIEITGCFQNEDNPYFTGNFTKPNNSSFSWFHMNKGLGAIETGDDIGTRTAIIIVIPTCIAFLGICGTVAIVCWASKKGYLRGRHKSYRLFTNAQVSYESEAETIHI